MSKKPEDIKPGWYNPLRAIQAACADNKGYGVVTFRVIVNRNEPVFWFEPQIEKIHPASLAGVSFSPTIIGLLANASTNVDNKDSGTVE